MQAGQSKLIFVYGTLKRGACRANLLDTSRFLSEAKTKPLYRLYSVCGHYPALINATRADVTNHGVEVEGEVYEIEENILRQLDAVEGIDEGLYERRPVELQNFEGVVVSYFWCGSLDGLIDIGCRW